MKFLRNSEFSLDETHLIIKVILMKSCLAMIIILIIFAGFIGTVAVMYYASTSTEIESTK